MSPDRQQIAVTGANGFIGSNLVLRLREQGHEVWPITRATDLADAEGQIARSATIFHLAGVNRPTDEGEFLRSNRDHTAWVADVVAKGGRKPLIVYSSSAKALDETEYGRSKRAGEEVLLELGAHKAAIVSIWRLPNVYGKWSRPNYNSVIATFCHNAVRGLPLPIDDPSAPLSLLYIDDLIEQWLELFANPPQVGGIMEPAHVQQTTVGEIAKLIEAFAERRNNGEIRDMGMALPRALYTSVVAAMPVDKASYRVPAHEDSRGKFIEVLKTQSSGQFSCFTAHPGATRGGHYHHSKVEKFLVAHGTGRFRFRHALTGESYEVVSSSAEPLMIETIPGWGHDVTNIGDDELVVLTWANEQFDAQRPDTHPMTL
ncbi:MAG: NAD-dependent epimerase/dehydratase family protein [Pseudomonadota bacterium]